MKRILLSAIFLCSCHPSSIEKLVLYPAENCKLELTAYKTDTMQAEFAPGVCVYKDGLYLFSLQNPPYCYLKTGKLYLDSQVIDLDVRNLATPWVEKGDLTESDIDLKKDVLEDIPYYSLKVHFCKGGGNDYTVEWEIYKGKSIRTAIKSINDVEE